MGKHRKITWSIGIALLVGIPYYFAIPTVLFDVPKSTVVTARDGQLLGAVVASDGQWRFPELGQVPDKFKQCILAFEDAYFDYHWGSDGNVPNFLCGD